MQIRREIQVMQVMHEMQVAPVIQVIRVIQVVSESISDLAIFQLFIRYNFNS